MGDSERRGEALLGSLGDPWAAFDYLTPLLFVAVTLGLTRFLISLALPSDAVVTLAVIPLAALAAVLERLRPERRDFMTLDQPFLTDLAHFFLNYELGYVLAAVASALLGQALRAHDFPTFWPSHLHWLGQLGLAVVLGEAISYWQHRLAHRWPAYWRFHALHHSGAHLNLVRVIRFHFVDVGPAAFVALLPLIFLGAPEEVVTLYLALTATFGLLGHANIRMRTPAFLSWLICTPAVHRHHHARDVNEGNSNFGTSVMIFDLLFGTFQAPRPAGPLEVGIQDDPVPRGFWAQMVTPFRSGHARAQRQGEHSQDA